MIFCKCDILANTDVRSMISDFFNGSFQDFFWNMMIEIGLKCTPNSSCYALLILPGKNCQQIPPGTLNMFLRLWMITELAQMKIFALKVLQPGGAAIIFPKSGRNQK